MAKARSVLWYLVFAGFGVNYMIRINLNITIVDMVKVLRKNVSTSQSSNGCGHQQIVVQQATASENQLTNKPMLNVSENILGGIDGYFYENSLSHKSNYTLNYNRTNLADKRGRYSIEKHLLSGFNILYDETGFEWNEYQQGLLLGSYFWLHWLTQIPGGILAKKYGTKVVFGVSNLIGCWICFLLPIVSYSNYKVLIAFRIVQGLICGLAWPAMHHMTAQWIPPNERSKFVTAYLGGSVGIAVCYPLFGCIISWSSWEWVFHVCGILGTIWYIAWVALIFDTPSQHPSITIEERKFIETSLGASVQHSENNPPTPWKEIFTSKPVWMNVIAQWGGIWGLFTIMTQAPTYFKTIHGWNIQMTGLLSGMPHIMRMLFAYCFSLFGDYLLRSDKMSRTNVRKLATTMCCIVNGIFVLCLAYSGCNSIAAVVFLTLATAFHGAVSTGTLASIVDIAPNYAGIVLGISGMIGVLPGFISPVIVGILTLRNQTTDSWKYVFLITSGMLIVCGLLNVLFCESNIQHWNTPKKTADKEMQLILTKEIEIEDTTYTTDDRSVDCDNDPVGKATAPGVFLKKAIRGVLQISSK